MINAQSTPLAQSMAFNAIQDEVQGFTDRFKLPCSVGPGFPNPKALDVRVKKLEEEVKELRDAVAAGDLAEVVDACVDIIYVTLGVLCQLGVKGGSVWAAVCLANAKKICGPNYSVVKPHGWTTPDVEACLRQQGWTPPEDQIDEKGGQDA